MGLGYGSDLLKRQAGIPCCRPWVFRCGSDVGSLRARALAWGVRLGGRSVRLRRLSATVLHSRLMKILAVSPRTTDVLRDGSRVRIHNLLNHLAGRHEVVCFAERFQQSFVGIGDAMAALGREVPAAAAPALYTQESHSDVISWALRQFVEASTVHAPVLSGVSLSLARPHRWRQLIRWADVVQVEFPWQFSPTRREAGRKPVVYCSHNIEAAKFRTYPELRRSPLAARLWLSWIDSLEAQAVRQADLVVAVSPQDQDGFVERYGADPARVVVAVNAADTDRYRPVDAAGRVRARRSLGLPERPTVLFLGASHPPNTVALNWVRQLSLRMPHCTFLVVGTVAQPGVEGSLIRTGMVADPAPYLAASEVSLVPIEFGAGTKIKLLESCAAGLPVLAFPEAIAGTRFQHQQHLLVVDKQLDALADALCGLLSEPSRAFQLGLAARRLVEECYDWRASGAELEQALLRLPRKTKG